MIEHLQPMPGYVVGLNVPDPEQARVEAEEDAKEVRSYERTKFPTRSVILIDIGVFGEENSMSYIHGWPEGLEPGARVVLDNNGFGLREAEGCVYFHPSAIIAWEPALDAT